MSKHLLTLYSTDDKIIEEIEISNRSENEAYKESQYYIRTCNEFVADWTLKETND